jgi:hypothetical protein
MSGVQSDRDSAAAARAAAGIDPGTTRANDDREVLVWLYIILVIALVFAVIMTVASGGAWTIFAIPIGVAIAGVMLLRVMLSGRETPRVVARPPEPTGVAGTKAGPGTANVRVGQEPANGGSV